MIIKAIVLYDFDTVVYRGLYFKVDGMGYFHTSNLYISDTPLRRFTVNGSLLHRMKR